MIGPPAHPAGQESAWSAALQTGIAATGRETPVAGRPHGVPPSRAAYREVATGVGSFVPLTGTMPIGRPALRWNLHGNCPGAPRE